MTETEIARALGGDVPHRTVSRDLQTPLREGESLNFIHTLAKSDLALYCRGCIDGIADVKEKESLELHKSSQNGSILKPNNDTLFAIKLVMEEEVEHSQFFNAQGITSSSNGAQSDVRATK